MTFFFAYPGPDMTLSGGDRLAYVRQYEERLSLKKIQN